MLSSLFATNFVPLSRAPGFSPTDRASEMGLPVFFAPVPFAASFPTIEDDQLVYPTFLTQPCPDYVMPSRAIQPTSTPQSTCESPTVATVNVNTLLPNETAMEECLLVPRRAISLAKQFLEASFDVVALQETRTRLAGTFRLSAYTAISTDAGPEAYNGVQLWFGLPASDRGEHGQMAHDRTAFRPESLFVLLEDPRVLEVSATSTTGQKMLVVTFHAPHAARPPAEVHAWWTRFDELVAAWKMQFSHIVLLGDADGRVGSDPSLCCGTRCCRVTEQYRSSVASGAPFACLLASSYNVPRLDRLTVLGPGKPPMEKQNTALITSRCLRLGNNYRSKSSIILRVTLPWDPLTTLPPPPG